MKVALWFLLFAAFSAGAAEDTTSQILAEIDTTSSEEIRLSAVFLLIEEQLADKGYSSVQVGDLISVSWADGSTELAEVGCVTDALCVALVEGSQTQGYVDPLPDSAPVKPGAPRIEAEPSPDNAPIKPGAPRTEGEPTPDNSTIPKGPRIEVVYDWEE